MKTYTEMLQGQSFFVSQLFSVAVLCLAKCSVTWLFLRVLSDTGRNFKAIKAFLILNVLWGFASIVGLAADCNPSAILTTKTVNHCPQQVRRQPSVVICHRANKAVKLLRWQVITAVDIATDVVTCLLPLVLVWNLRMPFGMQFQVVAAFAFRAPLVAFSALHLAAVKEYQGSTEPQFAVTAALIFQQAIVSWSLISATIPNLGSFIKSFSMDLGVPMGRRRDGMGCHSVYALQTIGGSAVSGRPRETWNPISNRHLSSDVEDVRNDHSRLCPDRGSYNMERRSPSRSGSRELIVRKEMDLGREPRDALMW